MDSFWKHWNRDMFPLLVPRKKWNAERRWTIGRVMNVYPGSDGKIRNVKVKTPTSEYQRPITKIVIIYPAEGYEGIR